jgi:hypothetical protein
VQGVGVALAGGDPVGDPDPLEAVDLGQAQLVDQPPDAGDRLAGGRFRQQDRELVAADPEALVGAPGGADRGRDGAQDGRSGARGRARGAAVPRRRGDWEGR